MMDIKLAFCEKTEAKAKITSSVIDFLQKAPTTGSTIDRSMLSASSRRRLSAPLWLSPLKIQTTTAPSLLFFRLAQSLWLTPRVASSFRCAQAPSLCSPRCYADLYHGRHDDGLSERRC